MQIFQVVSAMFNAAGICASTNDVHKWITNISALLITLCI